ncbi:PepSY domain-containing protein [Kocuria marina subsp. indica]|nr:PepSY domain-containing protein [Kocuria indica]
MPCAPSPWPTPCPRARGHPCASSPHADRRLSPSEPLSFRAHPGHSPAGCPHHLPSRGTSSCPQYGTHCRPNAPARARAPPTPGSWPCCKDCTLPLRTTIDWLHRDLLLGEPGRLYSELAASCSRRISRSPSSHNAARPGNPRTDHPCGRRSPNGPYGLNGPRRLNGRRSLHERRP